MFCILINTASFSINLQNIIICQWAYNQGGEGGGGGADGVKSEGVYKPQFMVVGIGLGRWLCL